jgi:1-phosphatidylinositol-3-phosphate 5-kinase
MCHHTDCTTYIFRSPRLIFILTPKPAEVLETRLPKLQVGPNVPKRKAGKAAAMAAVEGLRRREEREGEVRGLKLEVEVWFKGMRKRVEMLVNCLGKGFVLND